MSMTKKDFIALADFIRGLEPETDLWTVTEKLGDFLSNQYPSFNRDRWINYVAGKAGPSGGKI